MRVVGVDPRVVQVQAFRVGLRAGRRVGIAHRTAAAKGHKFRSIHHEAGHAGDLADDADRFVDLRPRNVEMAHGPDARGAVESIRTPRAQAAQRTPAPRKCLGQIEEHHVGRHRHGDRKTGNRSQAFRQALA